MLAMNSTCGGFFLPRRIVIIVLILFSTAGWSNPNSKIALPLIMAMDFTPSSHEPTNHQALVWLSVLDQLKNRDFMFSHNLRQTDLPPRLHAIMILVRHPDKDFFEKVYPGLHLMKIPFILCLNEQNMKNHLSWHAVRTMLSGGAILANAGSRAPSLIKSDPQGDLQPWISTRAWSKHGYEPDAQYHERIRADLEHMQQRIVRETSYKTSIVVWPADVHSEELDGIGRNLGLKYSLYDASTGIPSDPEPATLAWHRISLHSIQGALDQISLLIRHHPDHDNTQTVMHVNLDYVYDKDPAQENFNLNQLIHRINSMDVSTVYLQAFADPDGNGAADAVYFPTTILPVRQDLFNHVAWQIHLHTHVRRVYAWMPLLAWQLPSSNPEAHDQVVTLPSRPNHTDMGYPRLSPFSAPALKVITAIYKDLAQHCWFNGLLFHDDATLSDFEDDSPAARAFYEHIGLPGSVAAIRQNPSAMERWTLLKTAQLDRIALHLADTVRNNHPGLKTARNLYAQVVLNPASETWYAQSLSRTLQDFDYAAIEAMPYMENATDHPYFYHDLLQAIGNQPQGLQKTVFELQTKDWRSGGTPIPTPVLAQTVCMLYGWGVVNIGYIPDDPFRNNPDPTILRPALEHHCASNPHIQSMGSAPMTPP